MKNGDIVWIVGKYIPIEPITPYASVDGKWEMEGVWLTEDDAKQHCILREHFYAPIEIGKDVSNVDLEWPGLTYPNLV